MKGNGPRNRDGEKSTSANNLNQIVVLKMTTLLKLLRINGLVLKDVQDAGS